MAELTPTMRSNAEPPRGKPMQVLVIEDSETDREIAARYLGQAWPFEREARIEYAADGREALDKMRSTRFALVVLDWRLPGVGGRDVLRDMRQNGVYIPVVVLSGLQREAIADDLDALGASFLHKDGMTAETIRAAIARSLRLLGFVKTPTGVPPPAPRG